jgi:hypothetical protein
LHREKLHYLYYTENIIREMKSRRMRWAGYVTRMAEIRNSYKYEERRLLGRRGRDGP